MTALTFTLWGITHSAASLADASRMFSVLRDQSGEGASTFPSPRIKDAFGKIVGRFSYNGRIWTGDGATLIYDNR